MLFVFVFVFVCSLVVWVYWGNGVKVLNPVGHEKMVKLFQELPATHSIVVTDLSLSDMHEKYKSALKQVCNDTSADLADSIYNDCKTINAEE
jgi:hypothetical protein